MPYWNLFVGRNKEEIDRVCTVSEINYDATVYESYRNELGKMKFTEFCEWIDKLYKNNEFVEKN